MSVEPSAARGRPTDTASRTARRTRDHEYWKKNIRIILGCLAVWAFVSFGCAILFRPLLSAIPIGGTDLGFWFAQQGSILVFLVLIFFYAWRMNKLDREYGTNE